MIKFSSLLFNVQDQIAEIVLQRPNKANALDERLWSELSQAMRQADQTAEVRAIILKGEGANFCAGIDLAYLTAIYQQAKGLPEGRRGELLRETIKSLQEAISSCEQCRKPVIAAIDGACYGGGVALITACDFRYGTENATFSVKEIDLGIVADVGTLQRLPRIIGEGRAREWILTGEAFSAGQAYHDGLLTKVLPDRTSLENFARSRAQLLAQKSPLAMRGTKQVLNYSRDHAVAEGLEYVAAWNAAMLLTSDLAEVMKALPTGRRPVFSD